MSTKEVPAGRGRNLGFSLPRRWVNDLLHFAKKVPVVSGERQLRVQSMMELRRKVPQPPTWSSLMIKAFGIVGQRVPELRRAYMPYPWPHLYESPYSVATVIFDRVYEGEHAAFCAPILHPECRSLAEIAAKTHALQTDPIERHGALRRLIRTSKLPWPVRRMVWTIGMYGSGFMRARNFGTFAINSLAGMRGRMTQSIIPITTHIYYGLPSKTEGMLFQCAFDHRVYDAYTLMRACNELEAVFNGELLEEVKANADGMPSDRASMPRPRFGTELMEKEREPGEKVL
jgi:hypothetical protein